MLMHFYSLPRPFIDKPIYEWPQAQYDILEQFNEKGLVAIHIPEGGGKPPVVEILPKGAELVKLVQEFFGEMAKSI